MKSLDDGFLPMFEMDEDLIQKVRASRNEWWRLLKIMRDEYNKVLDDIQGQFSVDSFDLFVERNFGVKIQYDSNGNITGDYLIVDKNKHLLLLMKYGK